MKNSCLSLSKSSLEDVRHQFDEWRKTRTKRTPIPQTLWDAALSLVPDHSVCQVSKTLSLDYKILRERVRQRETRSCSSFIELDLHQLLPGSECVIEMEHRSGGKLRVSLRGGAQIDLLEIARAFWNQS